MSGSLVLGVVIGVLMTLVLAWINRYIISWLSDRNKPTAPSGIDDGVWETIVAGRTAARPLGVVEAIFSFCMFWIGAYVAIAGWFALKVASKWETWSNIIKFPETLSGVDELDFLRARTHLGTWIMSKFLLGSLLNLLAGFVGMVVGREAVHFLPAF